MIKILDKNNSLLNRFVAELRDAEIQQDSMRFRRNLERVGEVMAYEISKTLNYSIQEVETPLGVAEIALNDTNIVIATVLRAGLPYHQGFLNYFDTASSAFISAYRKYSKDGTFHISIDAITSVDLENKVLIIVDPMLATGQSLIVAYDALVNSGGNPLHTHIAAIVSSREGVDYVKRHVNSENTTIWSAAVDEELTVKSYIIPGIGDAGDLAFGEKL